MRIKNPGIFAFIAGYHLVLLALIPFSLSLFNWASAVLFAVTYVLGGLAITAGYHRCFAHKTYEPSPWFEWATLLNACLAVEASALRWSFDHRLHHSHVDTDKDPYSINKGFWYAHILWLFDYDREIEERIVADLMKNRRVMFQHRHIVALTVLVNLAVFGIGCLFMHPLAALVAGVLGRMFFIHHCTWFINSLAHVWGSKTYAKELSAVDNGILALLTFGEGYHNYHHAVANDYRNGIRWYHFDPTKWLLWTASRFGAVRGLRRVHDVKLQRMLVNKDKDLIIERISREIDETAVELKRQFEELSHSFEVKAQLLMKRLREVKKASDERKQLLKIEIRQLKKELRAQWKSWVALTQLAVRQYEIAHAH